MIANTSVGPAFWPRNAVTPHRLRTIEQGDRYKGRARIFLQVFIQRSATSDLRLLKWEKIDLQAGVIRLRLKDEGGGVAPFFFP